MMAHMKIQLLLVSLAICICAVYGKAPKKIVEGEIIKQETIPQQVLLTDVFYNGTKWIEFFCGGVILDKTHILTAASCIVNRRGKLRYEWIRVYTAVDDMNLIYLWQFQYKHAFNVTEQFPHPNFTHDYPFFNDIAVLKLDTSIEFSKWAKPAKLATQKTREAATVTGTGYGWDGKTRERPTRLPVFRGEFKKFGATLIERSPCNKLLREAQKKHGNLIGERHPGQICAIPHKGAHTCHRDAGGPLFYNGEVIGIAGLHFSCKPALPELYTSVFYYKKWIEEMLKR